MCKVNRFHEGEVELEYLLTGEEHEETILFVHGVGGNLRQFIKQHKYFSSNYRVLSISLRGHGYSSIPEPVKESHFTLCNLKDDIVKLLQELGVESFHFVGNSAGGLIGFELLKEQPSYFSSIITFGTTAELRLSQRTINLIVKVDTFMMRRFPKAYCRFMSKHSSKVKSVQQEVFAMFMMAKDSVAAFRENIGNYSYIDVIENCPVPYLLIQGEYDKGIEKQLLSTQEAISKNDHASICHIEKAGHIANLDQPKEFNELIERFIKAGL